ncbi:putative PAZ domain containing protein [Lyophyllum shimeji]|uniref:PAZ domain containing protein n=1 Tax=Lyophyllum shimeji TaxID=47721 RepID=A0A9P3PDB0_LYOSH|nr:putative PAZ domain containing protein [Lyophyllum shimeji]
MLSVWKRTWKEKDPSVHPSKDRLDAPSSSASTLGFTAAAHPSDTMSSAFGRSTDSRIKRPCTDDDEYPESLRKRPRTNASETALSKVDRDTILEEAKRRNTIAILPPGEPIMITIVQFLEWTVENERLRLNAATKRRRTALLVANDDSSSETHDTNLRSVASHLLVGRYDAVDGSAGAEPRAKLLQHDVVVVNSSLLLESLINGTLALTQFHAMIFVDLQDEQGGLAGPILQIMHHFYLVTDFLSRPRILGFASPHVSGVRTLLSMEEIKATMDASVLDFTSQEIAGDSSPLSQTDLVLLYDRETQPTVPVLLKELELLDPSRSVFREQFDDARHVLEELGPCASDLTWRRALKESDARDRTEDGTQKERQIRDRVKNWTFVMPNIDPSSRGFNASQKVLMLVQVLEACEPYGECFRGVVLVRQQAIAVSLVDLLRRLDEQLSFLRPVALLGDGLLSDLQRQDILQGFTAGMHNLLIMSEPKKDWVMPKTSIIIYFDQSESLTKSRAFSSARETHRVHLVPKSQDALGNVSSRSPDVSLDDPDVLRPTRSIGDAWQASASRAISQPVNSCLSDARNQHSFIQDPTTSSRIYLWHAADVVHHIASSGLVGRVSRGHPVFHYEETRESGSPLIFTCTVIIPGIEKVTGPPCASRGDAQRAACYKLCQNLTSMGLLDYRVFPRPPKSVTSSQSDSGSLSDDKLAGTRSYVRKSPDFWINTKNAPLVSLYPVVVSTSHRDEGTQPYAPLAILTRQPLPDLTSFKIFYSGVPAVIDIKRGAALRLEETQLNALYLYTLRMCRVICNKPFECTLDDMVYFLAPLPANWTSSPNVDPGPAFELPSIAEYIPWDLVCLAGDSCITPFTATTLETVEEEIQDAVIQDRATEFTRRYAAVRLRPDLSPLSKPLDSPREAGYDNILAYCAARKGFEKLQDENQPLIEVSTIPAVLNQLDPTSRPCGSTKLHAKYLVPELSSKCTIPASTLRTARLLPSITRRIDDFLLVKELNAQCFEHAISDQLLHMALCTPSCGVEYDYERLELLGDAFLKYVSSIYLFVAHPTHTEDDLHTARKELISNRSLFQHACRIGLPAYIQSKSFTPKQWKPPNFRVSSASAPKEDGSEVKQKLGEVSQIERSVGSVLSSPQRKPHETEMDPSAPEHEGKRCAGATKKKKKKKKKRGQEDNQWLGDKAVADVAEAIIGAGYLTGGQDVGLNVIKALGIPVTDIQTWSDFGRRLVAIPPDLSSRVNSESIHAVEDIIGYNVKQPHLIAYALTHSSIQDRQPSIRERLEFIGDAILDFMVIQRLFRREQQLMPGGLTLLKGAMVSNSTLAAVCVLSGLHKHFQYKSHVLHASIQDYATKLRASQAKEYRNAELEDRPPGQFWLELAAPKVLSDIVEAVMGAVYAGDRFSSAGIDALFDKLLKPFYDKHITLKTLSHHPTKLLFELFQRWRCQLFSITTATERKVNVAHIIVHDVILASAEDPDPTIAARRASLFALDALEGDPGFFSRNCDCRRPRTRAETYAADKKNTLRALQEVEEQPTRGGVRHLSQDSGIEAGMVLADAVESEAEEE